MNENWEIQLKDLVCPTCGSRLRYIFKVDGRAEMTSRGEFWEHGHITEEVKCSTCPPGTVLPTKLITAMKDKCRSRVLLETSKWRTI